jgi:alcohol dehydrogenase (cytochrome c)
MGYSQHRFSPLTHINRDNVKRLVPAWSYSMADNRGQEAQALVKDGIIYLTDHEKTVVLDALSGKQIWKSVIEYPPDTTRVVCCGIVNRGAVAFAFAVEATPRSPCMRLHWHLRPRRTARIAIASGRD